MTKNNGSYIMFKCQRDNCKGNLWSTKNQEIRQLIELHKQNKLRCPRCQTPLQPTRAWGIAAAMLKQNGTTITEQEQEA
jgi:uncharacterized paraquat-inducible protein A